MKNIILLLTVLFLFGCGKKDTSDTGSKDKKDTTTTKKEDKSTKPESGATTSPTDKKILGTYTGDFVAEKFDDTKEYVYSNRITVSIDSAIQGKLFGHSVVAGNLRPFTGTYAADKNVYNIEAAEPGDDKYDGKFSFSLYTDSSVVRGKWTSFKPDVYVTERSYRLAKKDFSYSPALNMPEEVQWAALYEKVPKFPDKVEAVTPAVSKYNASAKLLEKKDVENLYKGDLEIIRNAIYARHGYSFKSRRMRFIFDTYVDWYMPVTTDVRAELTDIEQKNIELIKRYEEHADKYYDDFGR